MDNNYKDSGFVNAKEEQVYKLDTKIKQKYEVIIYAYTSFTVEAESPEQANEIALNCPIGFEMVKQGECPEVLDYHWSWSDAMGSEVYNEEGEIALCDW
jgi:hypothetical protein